MSNIETQDVKNVSSRKFTGASERFLRIKDTVNEHISILVDTDTGFLNATKTLNQFYDLYPLEEGCKQKDINSWTRGKGAKELIALVSDKYQIEKPIYELDAGTPNEYKGTYMCSKLYDSFLMWLDRSYGLDLLDVIEKSRSEKIVALTKERDDALQDKLEAESTLSKVERMIQNLTDEFRAECKEANQRANKAETSFERVKTEIGFISGMLKEKSIHSTMDPIGENGKLVHNYVCM